MERLTKTMRCQDGARLYDISNELFGLNISRADKTRMILEKLADYEDLEEQGRLVKLPCKVGDVVYFAHHDRVISSEVLSEKYHAEAENHGVFIRERLTIDVEGVSAEIDFGDIGKTVFLTKSEAEAKLKELRGGENG